MSPKQLPYCDFRPELWCDQTLSHPAPACQGRVEGAPLERGHGALPCIVGKANSEA